MAYLRTDKQHSREYKAALSGPHWRRLRTIVVRRSGGCCEDCGVVDMDASLILHHKHYENLGCELPADVQLLCADCHPKADRRREHRVETAREEARHRSGLDTYATKKYGEEWWSWLDECEVADEFDDWLSQQIG